MDVERFVLLVVVLQAELRSALDEQDLTGVAVGADFITCVDECAEADFFYPFIPGGLGGGGTIWC